LIEYRLYIGSKFTGILVKSDEKYPQMWRIHARDREPSDMVNLTRAKDAAITWAAEGGPGVIDKVNWKGVDAPSRGG